MSKMVLLKNDRTDDIKAIQIGFSAFAFFLSLIWAIVKKSWISILIILFAAILNLICQALLEEYARSICEASNSMFAPDWIVTTAAICNLGIIFLVFCILGFFGGNIRIWELKLRGYSLWKEVAASSESGAVEYELMADIKSNLKK